MWELYTQKAFVSFFFYFHQIIQLNRNNLKWNVSMLSCFSMDRTNIHNNNRMWRLFFSFNSLKFINMMVSTVRFSRSFNRKVLIWNETYTQRKREKENASCCVDIFEIQWIMFFSHHCRKPALGSICTIKWMIAFDSQILYESAK